MSAGRDRRGFISVGAVCQRVLRVFSVWVERVVLLVLRLKCLVKRREALRGRNLPRDSRASGCAKGASGLWGACRARGRFLDTHWTPEPCLRKSAAQAWVRR